MMEEKRLVPKKRFKHREAEWNKLEFNQLLNENDGIRRGPFGSALKKEFFVKNSKYVVYEQQNAIYDHFNTRYNISKDKFEELNRFELEPNDFIMSGAGTIGSIARVPNEIKKGVINQALIRIRIKEGVVDSEYFLQWIRSKNMQDRLKEANPASAMENLIPMSDLKKWNISIPNFKEQQKIGEFFKVLDEWIANQERKIAKVKALKEAYLTEMFPQEGETVPKRRFKGFTDEWNKHQLSEIANIVMGHSPKSINYTNNPNDHILVQGNADIKNNKVRPRLWTTEITQTAHSGDIILTVRAPVGEVAKTNYNVVLGRGVSAIKGNEFLFQYLLKLKGDKYWETLSTGSTFDSINSNDIKELIIKLPSLKEQQKIGSFFKNLDNQIEAEESKLEKLKKMKEAYLEEMFV